MFGSGPNASDKKFYEAFDAHAQKSVEAARLLIDMLKAPERSVELAKAIGDVESAGDQITHDTIARLHKIWITPLDRADIHSLISRLDDVLDMIEAVSERLMLYEIREVPEFAHTLAITVLASAEAVDKAVSLLPQVKSKPKEVLALCVEINRLENEADSGYRRALAELFKGGYDALHVMKWRDIIDNLEAAADRCEDVANILEGIVLEYA
jgi:predicted phosphate transport protein (TIGR00153 family)